MFDKSIILCTLLVTCVLSSLPACADTIPYVGVIAGSPFALVTRLSDSRSSLDMESNPGYMAGLTAGVTCDSWFGWNIEKIRTEAEVSYRSSKLVRASNAVGRSVDVSSTVTVTNFMVNGYLENSKDMPVTLFLTAGAGAAMASIGALSYQDATLVPSASNTQFAYQGGVGIGYELTSNIMLDTTYKYFATTPFTFAGIKADYGSHTILLGARYQFK